MPLEADSDRILKKAYNYTEIHRIRERILSEVLQNGYKTIMLTSPHDRAGTTFFVSVVGFNIGFFSRKKVLLVDTNIRQPRLHELFGLNKENGFCDVALGQLSWKDAVKRTEVEELRVITAGEQKDGLWRFLNRLPLKPLIGEMAQFFDLILFDTSPVLIHNRNNVDPAILCSLCDLVYVVVSNAKTTKHQLRKTIEAIPMGREKINGIIYNSRIKNKRKKRFELSYGTDEKTV